MTVQDDAENLMTENSYKGGVSGKRTLNGSSLPAACNRRMSIEDDDTVIKSGSYATPVEVSNLSAYQSHAFVSR